MKKLYVTSKIWKEGNMFASYCPELDVASCGHTPDEAEKNLCEVIEIYLEETKKMGTLRQFLEECGFTIDNDKPVIELRKELVGFERLAVPVEMT